ncbi:glycosyltransferase family 4 protein [Clostridium botulinum]|uniref:Glycosyltransferase family 4 protein n=1 Tax=Clostridium botulinum TaxID=1491 RepID=A0A6B4HR39_CLOBO|nr:glycosyltransferase family 4 protein [Clostridium botulinum]MCS6111601.1 glycosyltransferase family 1 protein [Clostridium botulinum]NFE11020.1 glycosyltransferase family 4 protein [Clostridium botulinum]NFE60304.1 glycosyltransferase family 4 protein [Clostridium botulinum]NFE84154.1 glycosyltransferase family 4 protein [Clostridium botulinum]NFF87944.1 glycosyltransferase family 4 protein [Clostridium botulinum]
MKKILIITDKLYPDETGGSCTYAYETAIELQKYIDLDIFTCYPEKTYNNKFFLGKVYREFNKKNPIKTSRFLLKCINDNKYDNIIFHSAYSWFIYYCIKMFIRKNPIQIAIYHGPWHKEAKLKYFSRNEKLKEQIIVPLMKAIEYLYVKDNNKFIFLSNYMKNELININKQLLKKDIKIIPGGVNCEIFKRRFTKEEAKKKLGIENDKFVVFTLRRLEYRMGIQNAIKAISKMESNKKNNTILVVGGKGNYADKLYSISQKHKVNCRFDGFIPDDKVNLYFCAADLFIVPSIDLEGFGLVNLESLAMGVPVLACPQGGMIELGGLFENFYLCDGLKVDDITVELEKMYDLLKGKVCNEKKIKNYSWANISKQIMNYIKKN